MNKRQTSWTKERKRQFLRNLAETGNITTAARLLGSSRARAYEIRALDPNFAKLWNDAKKEAADNLEAEAWNRAIRGVNETTIHVNKRGKISGKRIVRRYSDQLLMMLLRHAKKRKYTERTESKVAAQVAIREDVKELTDEQLMLIAAQGMPPKKV